MKGFRATLLALAPALCFAAPEQGVKQQPDDAQLVRAIGRSASRLLEVATQYTAKEKTTVRRKLDNGAWFVQDVECNLRYARRDDGVHERRNHCSVVVDRGIDDLSQLILLFAPATINRYSFERGGTVYDVSILPAVQFRYEQREGPEALGVHDGSKVQRRPIRGLAWVANDGSAVFRVSLDSERPGGIRDHAEVNYTIDVDSAVVPVSAVWQQFKEEDLVAETASKYTRTGDVRP